MNTVLIGDALERLKELESNSVDCLVTDPPYGYSFMGKDWDRAVPDMAIWKECLRVLKPGSFAFIMSAPRLDVQSEMEVEDVDDELENLRIDYDDLQEELRVLKEKMEE